MSPPSLYEAAFRNYTSFYFFQEAKQFYSPHWCNPAVSTEASQVTTTRLVLCTALTSLTLWALTFLLAALQKWLVFEIKESAPLFQDLLSELDWTQACAVHITTLFKSDKFVTFEFFLSQTFFFFNGFCAVVKSLFTFKIMCIPKLTLPVIVKCVIVSLATTAASWQGNRESIRSSNSGKDEYRFKKQAIQRLCSKCWNPFC